MSQHWRMGPLKLYGWNAISNKYWLSDLNGIVSDDFVVIGD